MTETPTLRLERTKLGEPEDGFVDGWLNDAQGRTLAALSLPARYWAALESALDPSWAETILEQRDAAIVERDALREELQVAKLATVEVWDVEGILAPLRAAATAQRDAMKPVVEAALAVDAAWRGDGHGGRVVGPLRALESAVDTYRKGTETAPGATQAGDSPGGGQ